MFTGTILVILIVSGVTNVYSGHRVKRIVGGEPVLPGEIPYQVSVRAFGQHVCGGALIGVRHVLTAAHCLCELAEEPYEGITVVTGTTELKAKDGQKHEIEDIKCHPNYVYGIKASWSSDLVVVILKKNVTLNDTQNTIDLPTSDIVEGTKGLLSGWGRDNYPNPALSEHMLKLEVPIISQEICQTYHNFTILPSQICGFEKEGVGSCKGDSGNPLVYESKLVGIFSWTYPCALGYPDVYTNVYHFLDFINNATGTVS